jgi:3-phytase
MIQFKVRKHFLGISIITAAIFAGCQTEPEEPVVHTMIDSVVMADIETLPVSAPTSMDAADDPAIWIHPTDPSGSLILGTNKKLGIAVYNLLGEEIHFYNVGNVNNIDVRYGFQFDNGNKADLVACSERIHNKIVIYRINEQDGSLTDIGGDRFMSEIQEVYGFCLYSSSETGKSYAFINGKSGIIEQWELSPFGENEITGQVVRTISVESQPEGMVADDKLGYLYVGEEERGIWKFNAEPDNNEVPQLILDSDESNLKISYDIEGLTIYYAKKGKGYLIASSQGNDSYAIFERGGENKYLGSFEIIDGTIDGTEGTDGIDVTNINLGDPFSKGMFIVQDDENTNGDSVLPQNFKLVSWEKIAKMFDPPLLMDNSYNPY